MSTYKILEIEGQQNGADDAACRIHNNAMCSTAEISKKIEFELKDITRRIRHCRSLLDDAGLAIRPSNSVSQNNGSI
jgi:hypothetical protein